MKTYRIRALVTYYCDEYIEAKSLNEAKQIVDKMFMDGCFEEITCDGFLPGKIISLGFDSNVR